MGGIEADIVLESWLFRFWHCSEHGQFTLPTYCYWKQVWVTWSDLVTMDQSIWIGNYQLFSQRYSLDRFRRQEKGMAVWLVPNGHALFPTPKPIQAIALAKQLIVSNPYILIHAGDLI